MGRCYPRKERTMADQQPEALRLADVIDRLGLGDDIAVELRRLHQSEREGWRYADELEQERKRLQKVNADLIKALNLIQIECNNLHHSKEHRHTYAEFCKAKEWIDSVIANATKDSQ